MTGAAASSWYQKAGKLAGAVVAVGGLVWAVVQAIVTVGSLTASIKDSARDVSALEAVVRHQAEDTKNLVQQHSRECEARDDQTRALMRAALEMAAQDRRQQAVALAAVKTEVRVRARRAPSREVLLASMATDRGVAMTAHTANDDPLRGLEGL